MARKKTESFKEQVIKQLEYISQDGYMIWAIQIGIPAMASIMLSISAIWLFYIGYNIIAYISIFFALNFLYKLYISKTKYHIKLPKKGDD